MILFCFTTAGFTGIKAREKTVCDRQLFFLGGGRALFVCLFVCVFFFVCEGFLCMEREKEGER